MSKVVQSLDQSCPSTGCFGRTLKSSTGASQPLTSASGPPVPCVLVLVTKFPLGSWEHDTILYPMPKVRPNFNPHLQTYPDKTKPWCCQSYLFMKWDSCDLCSAFSALPPRISSAEYINSPWPWSTHLQGQLFIFPVFSNDLQSLL